MGGEGGAVIVGGEEEEISEGRGRVVVELDGGGELEEGHLRLEVVDLPLQLLLRLARLLVALPARPRL